MNQPPHSDKHPPCRLCHGEQHLLTLGPNEPFAVIQCSACGSLSHLQPPQPSLDYDDNYHAYHAFQWLSPKTILLAKKTLRVNHLASSAKGIWLDVGCGAGHVLHVAQNLGWKPYGLDLPNPAGRALQKSGIPVFFDATSCAEELSGKCHCITCWHTLEHVPDPLNFLAQLIQLLAPEGILSIETPEADLLLEEHRRHPQRSFAELATFPEHICIPTQSFFRQWAQTNGFEIKLAHAPRDGAFYELYFRQHNNAPSSATASHKPPAPSPFKQALACGASLMLEPLSPWVCTPLSWHLVLKKNSPRLRRENS